MAEVELKFIIDPGDHAAVRRVVALAAGAPLRRRMETTYFDTPDCELAARGLALRLRRERSRWLQTLKSSGASAGGLHAREEWEHERPDAGLDLSCFAQTPLAGIDGAATLHERLLPVFRVVVMRTTWTLATPAGGRLEVALDDGELQAGGQREAISELEIECLAGGPAAAFELAWRLLDQVRLRPSALSKSERGYRLLRGARLVPVKARAVRLPREASPADAARKVLACGLDQLQANEEGLLVSPDPEFVHQARIALRRLRAAMRIFRDAIGLERARKWRGELGEVARALGAARDWDVFATQMLPPVLAVYDDARLARQLRARVSRLRLRERAAAREALRSARYARVLLDIAQWLAAASGNAGADGESLRRFATRILRKRHKRLLRDAAGLASLPAPERHRVRIDAKRLRYGTDALASLFSSRRLVPYVETLARLQDALGEANDAATALQLLDRLAAPRPFVEYASAMFAARARSDPALLRGLVARLAATRLWSGQGASP